MIAIKNVTMPQNCIECPLSYLDKDEYYGGENVKRCVLTDTCVDAMINGRDDECPLIYANDKEVKE